MPRGDRTGPWGQGPMTGRGVGYCAGYAVPGYANPYVAPRGRGMGRGRGYGRRFFSRGLPWVGGRCFPAWGPAPVGPKAYAPYYGPETMDSEKGSLKAEAEFLKGQLAEIQARLEELTADEGDKKE